MYKYDVVLTIDSLMRMLTGASSVMLKLSLTKFGYSVAVFI